MKKGASSTAFYELIPPGDVFVERLPGLETARNKWKGTRMNTTTTCRMQGILLPSNSHINA